MVTPKEAVSEKGAGSLCQVEEGGGQLRPPSTAARKALAPNHTGAFTDHDELIAGRGGA